LGCGGRKEACGLGGWASGPGRRNRQAGVGEVERWAGKERGVWEGVLSFFQTPFQAFKFFSNQNTTNPIQIIFKILKLHTNKQETLCNQNMMHNHLLLLKLSK
jgi:hypothetical protein